MNDPKRAALQQSFPHGRWIMKAHFQFSFYFLCALTSPKTLFNCELEQSRVMARAPCEVYHCPFLLLGHTQRSSINAMDLVITVFFCLQKCIQFTHDDHTVPEGKTISQEFLSMIHSHQTGNKFQTLILIPHREYSLDFFLGLKHLKISLVQSFNIIGQFEHE